MRVPSTEFKPTAARMRFNSIRHDAYPHPHTLTSEIPIVGDLRVQCEEASM